MPINIENLATMPEMVSSSYSKQTGEYTVTARLDFIDREHLGPIVVTLEVLCDCFKREMEKYI